MGTNLHSPGTFSDLVVTALRRWPERVAFRQDDTTWTYAQLGDRISRLAGLLRSLDLPPSGGVGVLSPNRPEVYAVQTAPGFAGTRYTALHPLGSLDDHRYACDEAELSVLFVDSAYAERAVTLREQCASVEHVYAFGAVDGVDNFDAALEAITPYPLRFGEREPEDLTWLLYTGGTTGVPKAAMLPERAIAQMTYSTSTGWDLPSDRRYLACAPISHAAGMMITAVLLSGGEVALMKGFDPGQWLRLVADRHATISLLVPTMIYAVLDHPDLANTDLSSLHTVMYGASPMSPTRMAEAIERIGPVFCQLYGQTECAGITTSMPRADHDPDDLERLTACGFPMPGARVALRDDDGNEVADGEPGEVCVQGASVMQGYFKQPELTDQTIGDGWLRTGDVGVVDDAGRYYLVDRKKDMIVSGGFNVFPREIEDVVSADPNVAMVAVIGVPDDKWGEAVKAIVVAKPGATVDVEAVRARVRDHKGAIYTPKTVDVVESIPLTAVGKADKKVLRAQYWGDRARNVN